MWWAKFGHFYGLGPQICFNVIADVCDFFGSLYWFNVSFKIITDVCDFFGSLYWFNNITDVRDLFGSLYFNVIATVRSICSKLNCYDSLNNGHC